LGNLSVNLNRAGARWNIVDLNLQKKDASLRMHGSIGEDLSLDGELSHFDLSDLALWDSRLAGLSGNADLSFLAEGPTHSPEIIASLRSDRFQVSTGGDETAVFKLLLDSIHIGDSAGSRLRGIFSIGGCWARWQGIFLFLIRRAF